MTKTQKTSHSYAPGSHIFIGDQKVEKVRIDAIVYNKEVQRKISNLKVNEVISHFGHDHILWVQVFGLHDIEVIKSLGEQFHIHLLLQEDILNTKHRQKFELFGQLASAIIKTPIGNFSEDEFEQISIVAGKHFVITFLESEDPVFSTVEDRILNPRTRIIERATDYLMFALLDTVVDLYHSKLEDLIEEVDDYLEELIESGYTNSGVDGISSYKKRIGKYRRNMRPIADIASNFERTEHAHIDDTVRPFISDLKDHSALILDHIDAVIERLNEEFSILSAYSDKRLNDIMRVLTIYSVIFIPITFIAGVYGMNFEYIPELAKPNAYYVFWVVVILVVAAMLGYFYRKKWL